MSVRQKFGMILENKASKIEAIKNFQQEMFLETVFHTKVLGSDEHHIIFSLFLPALGGINPLIVYHVTKPGKGQ